MITIAISARVIEFETKVALQDETIETLTAGVTRLQAAVERLTQGSASLKGQLKSVAPPPAARRRRSHCRVLVVRCG